MSVDNVTHRGTVEQVNGDTILVKLSGDECRCDGCSITALCTGRSVEGPVITVSGCRDARHYRVGDRVVLTASSTSTMMSSLWLFVIPLIILVSLVLYGASRDGGIWSVLSGIAAMIVYDGILFLFRHRLASGIKWNVSVERDK